VEELLQKLSVSLRIMELSNHLRKLKCTKVVFIPHLFLHVIPLHILPLIEQHSAAPAAPTNKQTYEESELLLDLFPGGIRYSPSCRVLQQLVMKEPSEPSATNAMEMKHAKEGHGLKFKHLVGINNPDGTLHNTELNCIGKLFKHPDVFTGKKASVDVLQRYNVKKQVWNKDNLCALQFS